MLGEQTRKSATYLYKMSGFEKFLEALRIVGNIARTALSGLEEYRKIQETRRVPRKNNRRRKRRQRR